MEHRKVIAILLCFCLCANVLLAQREAVKKSTDPLCLLPSATALALTWTKGDREGMKQLAWSSVTAIGMNYALEFCIKEKRPDGTGDHAFPSTHTMAAFSGASFLQRRYGWKWGAPAYAIATYVGWGRVYSRRHNAWDVLAGAAIGAGCTFIYTRPFVNDMDLTISPAVLDGNGKGVYMALRF